VKEGSAIHVSHNDIRRGESGRGDGSAVSRPNEKFRFEPSRKFLLTAVRLKDGTNRDEPKGTR
jgi:hypothetical protein